MPTGRENQKLRTRTAILDAARALIRTGAPVTMPDVARAALVSEVTAYRYFPDLRTLLAETIDGMWPSAAESLALVADSTDPVERVALACRVLLTGVLAYQGGVRAMIAATIAQPALAGTRPDIRFQLIDQALDPQRVPELEPPARDRLRRQLVVVASAENLFCLTDRLGVEPDEAIEEIIAIATTLTRAAIANPR